MPIRNKKPKCAAANKACGMACKPKAAICADQRKKLVAGAKKSGLKGQAAKDYVQARIDRYKKLVDGAGNPPEKVTKKKVEDVPTKRAEVVNPSQKGGELIPTKKATQPPKETSPKKKSIFDQINEDWASESPTEDDAKAWINAHIEARFNPTLKNVEQRTAAALKDNLRGQFENRLGVKTGKFSGRIVDRDSYAKSVQAAEAWERKNRPEDVARRLSADNWLASRTQRIDGLKLSDIPRLEKIVARPSGGVSAKLKAVKDLASLKQDEADLPAIRAQVERDVAKNVAIQSASKADRIEQLKKEFDAEAAKQKATMESVYGDIKSGKKSAIADATFEAANGAGVDFREREDGRSGFENPTISDFQNRLKELAIEKDIKVFSVDKKTTKADVRKQYRALAEKAHPDKPGGSAEKFRRLTDAYNKVLQDFN